MTRQQQITRAQVANKRDAATQRCMQYLAKATDATSAEDFDRFMKESTKAARDAETWAKVFSSLS